MPKTPFQKAALSLLKPPALRYLRKLQSDLENDPAYLERHREDIGNIIAGFLAGSGFQWHQEILDREWPGILRAALSQLAKNTKK